MAKDLVLLRYTDARGKRLAALCRPNTGVDVLRDVVGEATEGDKAWFESEHESAIVIDTDGAVVVTSSEDMTMLAFGFAGAAQWLKTHGG